MMQIHLNFLHKNEQAEIKKAVILAWFRHVLSFILAAAIIFNGFLLLIFFIFKDQVQTVTRISSDSSQRYASYSEEVAKINEQAKQLSIAGESFSLLSQRFRLLANSVPSDIKITSLVLTLNDTMLTLPGTAKTREALIKYNDELAKLPWVEKTVLPKSQLLIKENVSFQIQIFLKPIK